MTQNGKIQIFSHEQKIKTDTMRHLDKKRVKYIVVHCSATMPGQQCDAETIDRWHRQRGWEMIGYHYVVLTDGRVEHGRPLFCQGAHVGKPSGANSVSVGVCYVGGLDSEGRTADTRTEAQRAALRCLLVKLRKLYPEARIVGHRDLNPGKACPCFDARSEYNF